MSITLKSCVLKPYQFKLLIYGFLSAHRKQYLSSLSSLIVLKLSNTRKFMLKMHTSYKNTVGYASGGKQLGKKLHVYIRSVY